MTITTVSAAQHGVWHDLATWEGWNMTGALAGVAAALVIIPAAIRYFRERYQPNTGYLQVSVYGSQNVGLRKVHLAELSNGGGAAVSIIRIGLVEAQGAWNLVGQQPRWWLGVGSSVVLPFEAMDEQKAWVLIVYTSMEDIRYARTMWLPLFRDSEADTAWDECWDRSPRIRWWQLWKRLCKAKLQPVGPGGALVAAMRGDEPVKNHARTFEIFDAAGGLIYKSGTSAAPKAES